VASTKAPVVKQRDAAIAWLRSRGTKANVEGMARYGIVASKPIGVSVGTIRDYAKTIGKDHALAEALFTSGWYEARHLAAFVGEPEKLTVAQMDRWARSFENWADCDGICFHLFDKSPLAWGRIRAWSTRKGEFEKRAAFALLASVALHDKGAPDAPFIKSLTLLERAATDNRNFVKKAVGWALRGVGLRNVSLNTRAIALAKKLVASDDATERWVGRDALKPLQSATARLKAKAAKRK
jgi:3-methyladenine DNA glycosylase AlkD